MNHHKEHPGFGRLRLVFLLAVQLLPAVLLVVFGWGFENLHRFLMDPARAGLTAVTLAAVFAAAFLKLNVDPLQRGPDPIGGQALQLAVLLLLSLILLWFLPFADRRKIFTLRHDYWRNLGLFMYAAGAVVRISALHALGKHFSAFVTLQPDHRLIQHGIYNRIRHPLYLSLLLAPTGFALVFASKLAFPIVVLAALFVLDRIRKEEELLASHFGSEFTAYRCRTWKLMPQMF